MKNNGILHRINLLHGIRLGRAPEAPLGDITECLPNDVAVRPACLRWFCGMHDLSISGMRQMY